MRFLAKLVSFSLFFLFLSVIVEAGTTSTQVSVTTTSTTVLEANVDRKVAAYINQSTTDVYVCWASTCTTALGTRFQENQGFVTENYKGQITAITSSGTATLGVYEHGQ